MKRLLCIALATVLAIFSLALTGCDDNKNKTSETKSTEISSQSAENVGKTKYRAILTSLPRAKTTFTARGDPKTLIL